MDRILPQLADAEPGVYVVDPDGALRVVHLHHDGEYALTDVIEYFELGAAIDELAVDIIELDRKELRELKAMAEACREDYPEEFIAMCVALYRSAVDQPGDAVRFYGNF